MTAKSPEIVFMGTPDFAVPSLKLLLEKGFYLSAVVTKPDQPKGRGRTLMPPPVKKIALDYGIEVLQPGKIDTPHFVDMLREISPDIIVVVAYGKILPLSILNLPPRGCLNLHASLLPTYRGAAPINRAIINGDTITGNTTILMDRGMDTGPVLLRGELAIDEDETAGSLHDKLSSSGAALLFMTIKGIMNASIKPTPQDDSKATYAPPIKKSDTRIEWGKRAKEIRNFVRGMSPLPCAYTKWHGKYIKILCGKIGAGHTDTTDPPGTVVETGKDGIGVATGEGLFVISELKPENRRQMSAAAFMRGYNIVKGEIFN